MYLTDNGFVISSFEIFWIIVAIPVVIAILNLFDRVISKVIDRRDNRFDDYPGSTKFTDVHKENHVNMFSDIADVYAENDLDEERREKVIFEENISGVPFRYNEKTRILIIGEKCDEKNISPIEIKLGNFDDLREFVDRLENYIAE